MTRRSILLDQKTADDFDAALRGPVRPPPTPLPGPPGESSEGSEHPMIVQFLIVLAFAAAAALVTVQVLAWF